MSVAAFRQWVPVTLLYTALAVFFGVSAASQACERGLETGAAAAIYVCLLLLLALLVAPGFEATRAPLRAVARGWKGLAGCLAVFLLPYLIYAAGTDDFRWVALAKLAAFCGLPLAAYAAGPGGAAARLNLRDAAVLVWLALPVLRGWIDGIWNVPVNLDFMARLFMVSAGAWAFIVWRGTPGTGYEFRLPRAAARDAGVNFAFFAGIGIPLGFALKFIAWNPQWRGVGTLGFDFVTIFVFIAWPEELFFRGLLQNLLEGSWRRRYAAQAAAAVLFGFSHIFHAPFPNWRYVVLASIAGWFYGSAYRGTRSLMAAATAHALVDTVWRTFLSRGAP